MEKAPALTTTEEDLAAQSADMLSDTTGENRESTAEEGELDTSPEATQDIVGEVREQLDAIEVSGQLDEQRFQREAQEVRAKIEAQTKEISKRKTTVDQLVKELLEDDYEEAEVEGKTSLIEGNLEAMEKLSAETETYM
jgi:predicted RNase H-like nuclease (RuvC/YqgF family)